MKHILEFNSYLNEYGSYDKWKLASPDDYDCYVTGQADFDLSLSINKANANNVPFIELEQLVHLFNKEIDKHFKSLGTKEVGSLSIYTPFDPIDESYIDYVDNGDGTYAIGSLAWKFTFEYATDYVAEEDPDAVVEYYSPNMKVLERIAKKYKWIKDIWTENIDTSVESNC